MAAKKTYSYPAARRRILTDIKEQSFSPVYLVYGEEAYLREDIKKNLMGVLGKDLNDMNVNRFSGEELSQENLLDLIQTLPFFAAYRLILVENSGLFKSGAQQALIDYVTAPSDTVHIVFVETQVDKRSRLFKAVSKSGFCVPCDGLPQDALVRWAGGQLVKAGRRVREQTVTYLISRVGEDMLLLQQELNKLMDYTKPNQEVRPADVDAVCATYLTGRIFEMTDAVSDGDTKRALQLYYDLLALKEPSQKILYLLTRQFNITLQAQLLAQRHLSDNEMASILSIAPFFVKKYVNWGRRYGTEALNKLLRIMVESDEKIKSGMLNDRIAVEMLLVTAATYPTNS